MTAQMHKFQGLPLGNRHFELRLHGESRLLKTIVCPSWEIATAEAVAWAIHYPLEFGTYAEVEGIHSLERIERTEHGILIRSLR